MKMTPIILIIILFSVQFTIAQEEDGVVALTLPVRNSLTFNRFALNPTFSFVREQSKFISLYNKREWVQFEDAPLTYMAGYTGRFGENIGAGVSVFQQNFGARLTFLKRSTFDRSKDQLQYALADAILLSQCNRLIGSTWSSFSELAQRLSKGYSSIDMSGVDF